MISTYQEKEREYDFKQIEWWKRMCVADIDQLKKNS